MTYPILLTTPGLRAFADAVDDERQAQLAKWGDQRHPDGGYGANAVLCAELAYAMRAVNEDPAQRSWTAILLEEAYEAGAESDPAKLRTELIQVAAVCAAWISDLDRRTPQAADAPTPTPYADEAADSQVLTNDSPEQP